MITLNLTTEQVTFLDNILATIESTINTQERSLQNALSVLGMFGVPEKRFNDIYLHVNEVSDHISNIRSKIKHSESADDVEQSMNSL